MKENLIVLDKWREISAGKHTDSKLVTCIKKLPTSESKKPLRNEIKSSSYGFHVSNFPSNSIFAWKFSKLSKKKKN